MDEKQAEAIADALLQEGRAEQAAVARKKQEAEGRRQAQRRLAIGGLVGLGAGMAIGQVAFGALFPAGMLGLGVGLLLGRLTYRPGRR